MVPRTDQTFFLQIHNDDYEIAEDPLERPLAPTIKEAHRDQAVRHQMQVARRYVQSLAQLRPIIDAAVKQKDKSICEQKGLLLKEIFRCQLVQTKHKGRIAAYQRFLPIRSIRL